MNTLHIQNNEEQTSALFVGFLDIQVLETTETKFLIKLNTLDVLDSAFWIDKEQAQTENKTDPSKIIRWLLKKLNKLLNDQQED